MQARTRKRPTDRGFGGIIVDKILRGPKENELELLKAAKSLGYRQVTKSIPWREAFSDYADEELPGASLTGARLKEGLTQKQLAEKLGVNQGYVSDMERGKRSIGKGMAKRLGDILDINYRVFL
jgi:ribosome-binding protein aMBF1 (putative translation factor)